MKYEKAEALVIEFESEDIITTSDVDCGFTQFDVENCDGNTQAVDKGQFGQANQRSLMPVVEE